MANRKKDVIIRSHRQRVTDANWIINNVPRYRKEKINIIQREAFVEFLLLEDIVELYTQRKKEEEKVRDNSTRYERRAAEENIARFSAVINIFEAAVGVAKALINSGRYLEVSGAIPEYSLMWSINGNKKLAYIRDLAIELLKRLSNSAMEAQQISNSVDENLIDLENHEKNVKLVNGDNYEKLIEEIKSVIPFDEPVAKERNSNKEISNKQETQEKQTRKINSSLLDE